MKKWFSVELRVPVTGHSKDSIYKTLKATGLIDDDKPDQRLCVITKKGAGGYKSKSVGSDYERRIADKLSKWWGHKFRRTPNSGGWDKQVRDGHIMAGGDIIAPDEAQFPFSVECKKRRERVNTFAPGSEFFQWWKQCRDDADTTGKIPLLIFNTDGTDYAAVPFSVWFSLSVVTHCIHSPGTEVFIVLRLDDFLAAELRNADGSVIKAGQT